MHTPPLSSGVDVSPGLSESEPLAETEGEVVAEGTIWSLARGEVVTDEALGVTLTDGEAVSPWGRGDSDGTAETSECRGVGEGNADGVIV